MTQPTVVNVRLNVDGSGDLTTYTAPVNGFLASVHYNWIDMDTGADITVTEESTGKALLTITNAGVADLTWRPRIGPHPVANTGAGTIIVGGTTTGGDGNMDLMHSVVGRIKVVVAAGGASKLADISFYIV